MPKRCWSGSRLTDAGDKLVKTYSGGMRRRLDIGASLIARPPVLFLDEPTTGLDPRTRNDVWEFVEELVASRHDRACSRPSTWRRPSALPTSIVVIDTGTVSPDGTADELKDQLGGNVLEARVCPLRPISSGPPRCLRNFAGSQAHLDADQQTVSVPTRTGTEFLMGAGRPLEDEHIALDDLGIRRPSSTTFSSRSQRGSGEVKVAASQRVPEAVGGAAMTTYGYPRPPRQTQPAIAQVGRRATRWA